MLDSLLHAMEQCISALTKQTLDTVNREIFVVKIFS